MRQFAIRKLIRFIYKILNLNTSAYSVMKRRIVLYVLLLRFPYGYIPFSARLSIPYELLNEPQSGWNHLLRQPAVETCNAKIAVHLLRTYIRFSCCMFVNATVKWWFNLLLANVGDERGLVHKALKLWMNMERKSYRRFT